MIRVGVLGAGSHSRREHLPALRLYRERHPDRIELVALCDPKVDLAAEYGFQHHCHSLEQLLERRVDAIIAITPVQVTADIALRVISAGIPLLMEKPLGCTEEEAHRVVAAAKNRPVMVSMNRRFDPAMVAMAEALQGKQLEYLRASMERVGRKREGFLEDAGVHALDVMKMLAGTPEEVGGTPDLLRIEYRSSALGLLELHPNGGRWEESYDAFGPGFHVQALATRSCRIWEAGKLVFEMINDPALPGFVTSGTYGETVAFLEGVMTGQALRPSPADVIDTFAAAHRLQNAGREPEHRNGRVLIR